MKPINDILLISMPWASSRRPLLGVGVLVNKLIKKGYNATSYYPNIQFAETFGYESYEFFADNPSLYPFAEYLFAAVFFNYDEKKVCSAVETFMGIDYLEQNPDFQHSVSKIIKELVPDFIDQSLKRVLATEPQIVGFSATFNQIFPGLLLAKRIKEQNEDIITILGGSCFHGEMGVEYSLRFRNIIDYVFTGEADNSLPAFMDYLNGIGQYDQIDGLAHGGTVTKDTIPVANLSDVASPDYDDYFLELDAVFGQRANIINEGIPFESSRGCWWGQKNHCTFCGLNNLGMDYRYKPDEEIIAELTLLSKKYKSLNFLSADNILRSNAYQSLLPKLSDLPVKFNLFYEVKANLKRADVHALSCANIKWIQPGIESFSTNVLKLMKKGVSAIQNIQLLRLAAEYGINLSYNILSGFKGETAGDLLDTIVVIDKILHLQPPSGVASAVQVHRFSPMHMHPGENGITELKPCSYYNDWFPQNFINIEKAAYFFEGVHDFESPDLTNINRQIQRWIDSKTRRSAELGFNFISITDLSEDQPAKKTVTVLNELESIIFMLTDEVKTKYSIITCLEEITDTDIIEEAIGKMVDQNILHAEGDKYLNLIPFNRILEPGAIDLWLQQAMYQSRSTPSLAVQTQEQS